MFYPICVTCGVQYPAAEEPPAACLICQDERQYIGWEGQQWTTLAALQAGHHNIIKNEENKNKFPLIMGGLLGAAQYEKLADNPGRAMDGMKVQLWAHIVIILFIIMGNVGFFASRRREKREGGSL